MCISPHAACSATFLTRCTSDKIAAPCACRKRLEGAAALDAGKLGVVARKNELRARLLRRRCEAREILRRYHRRLVHDHNRVARPARPAFLERDKFARDGVGVFEPVAAHLLRNVIRPCEADNVLALGLVHGARRFERVALAGSGLAPKHREALGVGELAQGVGLFRLQGVSCRRLRYLGGGDAVVILLLKLARRLAERHFRRERFNGRVAAHFLAARVRQADNVFLAENLGLESGLVLGGQPAIGQARG